MAFPVKPNEIKKLKQTDLEALAELDRQGLLIAPDESFHQYSERLLTMAENYGSFEQELRKNGEVCLFDFVTVKKKMRISQKIIDEASEKDIAFYGFSIDWVPGFFLSENIGIFWGGCALSAPELLMSIFLIRKSFAKKRNFLWIYSRQELLSHEICHVARMPLNDPMFEEYFAYRLSSSWLRRWFGCCFQSAMDAILFIVPIFVLLAARILQTLYLENLLMWPFFTAVAIYPLFMLLRTYGIHRAIKAATRQLKACKIENPLPVLYRCNQKEILFFAKHDPETIKRWLEEHIANDFRWQVINCRFIEKA